MRISIVNGSAGYDGDTVLSEINFEVCDNEKVAVVGRNGSGKTTLLKCLTGEVVPTEGDGDEKYSFTVSGAPRIGYLAQITFDENATFLDEILKSFSDVIALEKKVESALAEMDGNPSEEKALKYSEALDRFENSGGYTYKKEYMTAVRKFGFSDEDLDKKLAAFSGGQRTKIALIKLLLSKPDLLLLDEPTNHLDLPAVEWLENFLKNYKKSLVVVSHDRMFLDRVVNVVYETEYGVTTRYKGNYTAYVSQKQQAYDKALKDSKWKEKEIARLTSLVERFRYKATKAAMAQSKLKEIERIGRPDAPRRFDTATFRADFQPETESGRDVVVMNKLVFGYDKPLGELTYTVTKGRKIGVIGLNGTGKSTLLKTIAGSINPLSGSVGFGANVKAGYFDQVMAASYSERTVIEDFREEFPSLTDTEIRTALGGFLFTGDDVFKRVVDLSGGEKVRLQLCKIFKKRPNVLIFDEPTNHMDIIGKETLEKLLVDYTGTVIVVSHDRYLINRVSDGLFVFCDGGVKYFDGTYEEYEETRRNEEDIRVADAKEKKKTGGERFIAGKEEARRKHRIAFLEQKITALENEANEIRKKLDDPQINCDYIRVTEIESLLKEYDEKLEPLLTEWESLN